MLRILIALLLLTMPLHVSAMSRDLTIDGDHGKLAAVLQTPDGRAKYPLVIICHGFTGNMKSTLLTALADDLEAAGIASIRFDFNGHGQSEGRFQDMTVPNEIVDATKVYEYVRKLPGVTVIGLAGHSQGGVVASMLAGQLGAKKIKAIALMSPAPLLRDDLIRGRIFDVKFNPLNPPEFVEIFGGHKVGRNYIVTGQTLPIYETSEKFTGPALMIHGTGDVIVPYTYSLSYRRVYKNGKVELIDRADHGYTGQESRVAKIAADFLIRQLKK